MVKCPFAIVNYLAMPAIVHVRAKDYYPYGGDEAAEGKAIHVPNPKRRKKKNKKK